MKRTIAFLISLTFAAGFAAPVAAADSDTVSSTNISTNSPDLAGTDTNTEPTEPGDPYTNGIDMELVKVDNFWAGRYEVTQKQYQTVMDSNPSAFPGDSRPVDSVSWSDAMQFCARLTASEIKDKKLPEGYSYTLPTESEWETLVADASLSDAVTSLGGRRDGTAPVGTLGTNSLGLYDMRGNVMEFCLGDADKPYRVLRGSSWQDKFEVNLRLEFRNYCKPDDAKNTYGFRVLLKKS